MESFGTDWSRLESIGIVWNRLESIGIDWGRFGIDTAPTPYCHDDAGDSCIHTVFLQFSLDLDPSGVIQRGILFHIRTKYRYYGGTTYYYVIKKKKIKKRKYINSIYHQLIRSSSYSYTVRHSQV
jgi:hypothetical protein